MSVKVGLLGVKLTGLQIEVKQFLKNSKIFSDSKRLAFTKLANTANSPGKKRNFGGYGTSSDCLDFWQYG